jgi:hypothetical protein
MSAFYAQPWFAGIYWWRLETNGVGGPADNSIVPWRKPAMDAIRTWSAKPDHLSGSFTATASGAERRTR